MDAVVEKCLNCGSPLIEPRKLKDFCTAPLARTLTPNACDAPARNVRFGSLADMLGCTKKRPLYP
jgi:hypothetical protein